MKRRLRVARIRPRPVTKAIKYESGFFELIGLMWSECAEYRAQIEKYLDGDLIEAVGAVLDREFGNLLSENRRELIKRCLHHRQETLVAEVDRFKKV
jgi:hypothetical protein